MPLFGLGEIKFDKSPNTTDGPLASLYESEFKSRTLKYPLELTRPEVGHYMLIYIKKQKSSQLTDAPQEDPTQQALNSLGSNIKGAIGGEVGNFVSNQVGKLDSMTGGALTSIASGVKNIVSGLGSNKPKVLNGNAAATQSIINRNVKSLQLNGGKLSQTTFTGDVIALYMPETVQFGFSQNYDQLSLISGLAGLAGVAITEQIDSGGNTQKLLDAAKVAITRAGASSLGDIGRAGAFLGFGSVINPMLEVIYKSPSFRNFDYVFKFYPRSEKEGIEVQKIINMLQFHQAPEIKTDGSVSMLIPPSEFDLKFYYAGKENDNIPKIGSCILKNIQINYAPQGWSAYEVPGQGATLGGTGMPVAIEMTLSFQEVTYLTKNVPLPGDITPEKTAASQRGEYGTS
jgi:hypothetical protein